MSSRGGIPPQAGPAESQYHYVQNTAVPVTAGGEGGNMEVDVSW